MTYRVYRITGGEKPWIDWIATFEFSDGAESFCESEHYQQRNAIRKKGLGQTFVCINDRDGNIEWHKHFQWGGDAE